MGFTFSKSVRVGPFRVNVSRGGVGLSVGGRGFRHGVSTRRRSATTFSIPGTGVGYRVDHGGVRGARRGCALPLLFAGAAAAAAESLRRFLA